MQKIAADVHMATDVKVADFVSMYGCEIGSTSKVGPFVEIQKGVRIGNRCKISSHSFICEGVRIEDEVFVGHGVTFINDRYPRSVNGRGDLQTEADWNCIPTVVERGASIGSGATILCGVTIGDHAIVGAGAVVTRDVASWSVVTGNPARAVRSLNDTEQPSPSRARNRTAAARPTKSRKVS